MRNRERLERRKAAMKRLMERKEKQREQDERRKERQRQLAVTKQKEARMAISSTTSSNMPSSPSLEGTSDYRARTMTDKGNGVQYKKLTSRKAHSDSDSAESVSGGEDEVPPIVAPEMVDTVEQAMCHAIARESRQRARSKSRSPSAGRSSRQQTNISTPRNQDKTGNSPNSKDKNRYAENPRSQGETKLPPIETAPSNGGDNNVGEGTAKDEVDTDIALERITRSPSVALS